MLTFKRYKFSVSSVNSVVQKGFSLIELLVVLGIFGLALAIVPPMFSSVIPGAQVKTATRHLAAGLKQSRSHAITSQTESTFTIDVQQKNYAINNSKKQLSLPEDTQIILTTAQSEQQSEHTGSIRFFADGSSTGGQIKLHHEPHEYVIDINWLTGKVIIKP